MLQHYKLLLTFLLIALAYFLFVQYPPKRENLEVNPLDSIEVIEACKDMTVEKLVGLYGDKLDILTNIFVANNIPVNSIQDITQYPKIATLLVQKGYINEDMCRTVTSESA